MEIKDPTRALNNAMYVTGGAIVGGIAGARGESYSSNALWSAGVFTVANGLASIFNQQKFFSKETLTSTLIFTASSVAMHFLTRSASDHRLEPQITFAPTCHCKHKSWANRVSDPSAQAEMAR